MKDVGKVIIDKKAYEISYALCRIAAYARPAFASKIESCALDILESSINKDSKELHNITNRAVSYLRMGSDLGNLNKANVDIILREIGLFKSAISSGVHEDSEIEGIFSSGHDSEKNKQRSINTSVSESGKDVPAPEDRQSAKTRQDSIAEFVEEIGNCRMKDLLEHFPSISERTLRYDLQNLVESGVLDRMGEGGPGISYQKKMHEDSLESMESGMYPEVV
ncbi:MAG: DeoR family transcriptional regulator [Patescibacteria group bacterium]|nr:DeoR family transcriptional regulator [Patescibacteria group bacterium]